MMHDNDERIWNEWVANFEQAFADTASAERAYADLAKLEMRGDEIDEYIVTFEHLRLKTGWERGAHCILQIFKKGLPRGLHQTILQHDPIPVTMDEWRATARRKIQRRLVLANLGLRNEHPMARRNCLKEALRRPAQRQPQRDPDTRDVDATILGDGSHNETRERFGGASEAERRKRSAEGRCSGCHQGH